MALYFAAHRWGSGKGIYDVAAFETTLANRAGDNRMLSHDLFEGVYARCGLASDVELVEEFPSRYDVATARQHRWTRGDWQLLPWVLSASPSVAPSGSGGRPRSTMASGGRSIRNNSNASARVPDRNKV